MAQPPSAWSNFLNTLQLRRDHHILPAGISWRSSNFFIVSTIGVGMFTDIFLYCLIVPTLPFMLTDRLNVPEKQVQSYVSMLLAIFAGTSVVCGPFVGYLSDRLHSRQGMFLVGLIMMIAATTVLFFAQSIPVLIVARAFQGLSGAFVWTIGLALCVETVGSEKLGTTLGTIFSFIAVANFSAPIIGGFLYEKTGTIGVFVLAISLLTIDLGMRLLVIEKRIAEEYYAALPSSSEDGESTSDETEANDNEETPTETQPLLAGIREPDEYYILRPVSSKFLTNFPILRCLADPRLLTALFVTLIQALLFGAFDATIPIIGKSYFGFDSLKAGLLFVPLGSIELIAGPLFGWCVDHYGAKPVSVIGNIFLIPVFFCLRFPHAGGTDQVVLYALLLALGGAGLSAVGSPCIVEAGLVVDRFYEVNKDVFGSRSPYAQLYGMTNVVFSLGLTIGPELAGELKQIIGYGNMNALLAGICAIAGILSYLYMGGRPQAFARTKEVEDDV